MKARYFYSILFCVSLFSLPALGQEYIRTGGGGIIPDATCPNSFVSTIGVTGIPQNSGVRLQKVVVNINHTYDADLEIRLRGPNNVLVNLSLDRGGDGANFSNTQFVFNGILAENGSISTGIAPFTGAYYPESIGADFPLSNLNGNWRLEVCDDFADDFGNLLSWQLIFGRTSNCIFNTRSIACNQAENFTTIGAGNSFNTSAYYANCGVPNPTINNFNGPDVFYILNVPQSCNVSINLTNLTADLDLFLNDYTDYCSTLEAAPPGENVSSAINCLASLNTDLTSENITAFLPAGNYALIVDGYDPTIQGNYTISVTSDCPSCQQQTCNTCSEPQGDQPMGQIEQCDNFESYSLNNITPQSPNWELWDAGSTDAPVVNNPSGGNDKVLKIERTATDPDVLYLLGNRNSGWYRLSWQMFVPVDFSGYYNIQHSQTPGNWAYQVYFNADGTGELELGNNNSVAATFSYYPGNWNKVMQIIDIDANIAELWINGQFVFSWPFNTGSTGSSFQLGAINFYANPSNLYYVNNICLWQVGLNCGIVPPCFSGNEPPVCGKNGDYFDCEDAARCAGYTSEEWENCSTICDYGGTFIYRSDNFMGNLELIDLPPGMISGESCVVSAYDFNLPTNLYGDVYVFYNEPGGQIIISPTINNNALTFVFSCVCEDNQGNPIPCQQVCLGTADQVASSGGQPEGFYYILVLSEQNENYGFNIFPTGECSTNPVNINCGDNVTGNVTGSSNDFDLLSNGYQTCYNGLRNYTGEDKEYKLTLQQASVVDITLESTTPMAVFLYSYLCGENCIGYAENSQQGGMARLDSLPLSAGVYYLVIDKNTPGGNGAFNLSVDCQSNNVLPFAIINNPNICAVDAATPHQVRIPATAYPLSTDDQIHFLYKDGASLKTNDVLSQFWNGGSFMNFNLPRDATGDNVKCSYALGDSLFIYATKTDNGFRNFRKLSPVFQPATPPNVTATYTYANNGKGVINQLVENSPVISFTVTPTLITAPADPPTDPYLSFDLNTSIPWTLQNPTADWLSIPGPHTGSSDKRFYLVFEPNTSPIPRQTTLTINSNTTPPFTQVVLVKQLGACIAPQVAFVIDPASSCQGDSVSITANVVNALPDQYFYKWNTGDSTAAIRKKINNNTSFSVIVTDRYCFVADTALVQVNIEAPPSQPQVSQTLVLGCPGSSFPAVTANNVGPNQIVDWYNQSSGGQLIQSTNTFSPAAPGIYFGETRNLNGSNCTSTSRTAVTFSLNPAINISASNDVSICPGQSTTLSASATGGSGNFSFSWNNNLGTGTNKVVTPATTTTYTVSVTDANNCVASDQVTVNVFPPVDVFAGTDDGICPGESTILSAIAAGGNGVFTYTWNNGLGNGPTHTVSPSTPTTYSVTATDGNGCMDNDQLTINVFPVLTLNVSNAPSICPGQSVQISANANGGSGNSYSFSWSNGLGSGASHTVSPNITSTYQVTVTDGNGCSAVNQITVTVLPAVSVNAAEFPAICPGQNAILNAVAIGGNNSFTYNWSNGLGTGASQVVSPSQTTTYTVTATDGNNCSATDQVTITVFPALSVNASDIPPICQGQSAVINAIGVGGTNAFTYQWDNGLGSGAIHTISPTITTTYSVTATDGNNCSAVDQITVAVLQLPSVNAGVYPAICAGQSLTLSANSPSNMATFIWDNNLGSGATQLVMPSSTTTYTVSVTDANGCQSSGSTTVSVSTPSSANAGFDQTICAGASIALSGSLGGGASIGTWSPEFSGGSFQNSLNSLVNTYTPPAGFSGNMSIELITNAQAPCPAFVDNFTLTVNPLPQLFSTNDTCALDLETYTLVLSSNADAISSSLGIISNYGNGIFSISNIPEETGLNVTLINTSSTCTSSIFFNGRNCECPQIAAPTTSSANISICADQPIPPLSVNNLDGLSIFWYDQPNGGLPIGEGAQFTPDSAGIYFAEAADPNSSCVSSSRTALSLIIKESPIASAGEDPFVCPFEVVMLNAGLGNNYEYSWSNGAQTPGIAVELGETTSFILTVTKDGCQAKDTVTVHILPLPGGNIQVVEPIVCPDDSTGVLVVTPSGEHPPFNVLWSTGATSTQIDMLPAGDYSVLISDSLGCQLTLSANIENPDGFSLQESVQDATNGQANGAIEITLTGPGSSYTYSWTNNAGFVSNEEDIFNLLPSNYTLEVSDENGCIQTFIFVVGNVVTGTRPISDIQNAVKLFPNPSNGVFWLDFNLPEAIEMDISVWDLLGQNLSKMEGQLIQRRTLMLDLSQQAAGVYLLRINIGTDSFSMKLVRN